MFVNSNSVNQTVNLAYPITHREIQLKFIKVRSTRVPSLVCLASMSVAVLVLILFFGFLHSVAMYW